MDWLDLLADEIWSTGEENGKPLQYSCLENPMSSMKRPCATEALAHGGSAAPLLGRRRSRAGSAFCGLAAGPGGRPTCPGKACSKSVTSELPKSKTEEMLGA